MFGLINILGSLFSMVNKVAEYFKNKQLIDAGKNEAKVEAFHEKELRTKLADNARDSVDVSGLRDEDPNSRS